jgi:hypothetical protein
MWQKSKNNRFNEYTIVFLFIYVILFLDLRDAYESFKVTQCIESCILKIYWVGKVQLIFKLYKEKRLR